MPPNFTAINPALLHLEQSQLFHAFNPLPVTGQSAESLSCALISPDRPPSYTTTFLDHKNPDQKYFFPQWEVATEQAPLAHGTVTRRRVSMEPKPGTNGFILKVHLDQQDPRLSDPTLHAFSPAPALSVSFVSTASGVDVPFGTIEAEPGTNGGTAFVATLAIKDIDARNAVMRAMTDPTCNCRLRIDQTLDVGLRVLTMAAPPSGGTPGATPASTPHLASLAGAQMIAMRPIGTLQPPITAHPLPIPIHPLPISFTPHPLPIPIHPLPLPIPIHPLPTPPDPSQPSGQLYHQTTVTLSQVIGFIFDRDVEKYVFAAVGDVDTGAAGPLLLPYVLEYNGAQYTYFQPTVSTEDFFYLPDSFKLCRRPQSPYYPAMSLAIAGDGLDNATITMTYVAVQVTDPQRLADARTQLAKYGVKNAGKPMASAKTTLQLSLPTSDATSGPYQTRNGVVIDMASGFQDSITLPIVQFNDLFDSLFTDSGTYFQGWVIAHGDDANDYKIPFIARADDLYQFNVFDRQQSIDAASGALRVALVNATEAIIHVDQLPVELRNSDGSSVPCRLVETAPALPLDMLPATADGQTAGKLQVLVAPLSGSPSVDQQVTFDLSKLKVTSDGKAVWNAIADQSVVGHLTRTIQLLTPAAVFQPKTDGPFLTALQVVFLVGNGAGPSVVVDSSCTPRGANLTAQVKLPISITDYILRLSVAPEYQYARKLIYSDGSQITDTGWTKASSDQLFVSLSPTAVTS